MKNKQQNSPGKKKPMSDATFLKTRIRDLELGKCYINEGWEEGGLASVVVTRVHGTGKVSCGLFLVDLLARGITDAFFRLNIRPAEFEKVLESFLGGEHVEIDYNLAHNIMYAGLEYGGDNGFKGPKDLDLVLRILEEDTETIPMIDIPLGMEGKPVLFIGPEDNEERDVAILEAHIGAGNFDVEYLLDADELLDDDDDEEDEEEEETDERGLPKPLAIAYDRLVSLEPEQMGQDDQENLVTLAYMLMDNDFQERYEKEEWTPQGDEKIDMLNDMFEKLQRVGLDKHMEYLMKKMEAEEEQE